MPGKVVQLKSIGNVTFLKNRRSKNIKISVKPDKSILVSFPFYCTALEAMEFVQSNEVWIKQQQEKMEFRKNIIDTDTKINTKLHEVSFLLADRYDVETQKSEVRIMVKNFDSEDSKNFIEDILVQVYRFEAKKILPIRLAELASKYDFEYEKVTIRNNKRNWGSCSAKNNISLNLQMMKLPDELIDYILLHELVHTKIKNHSSDFWDRLNEITDNQARELARQVKKYSTYTL